MANPIQLKGQAFIGQADAAPMKKSTIWSRGSHTSRVKLEGLDKDARFFISTMERPVYNFVKRIHAWIYYVDVNIGGKKELVSINALAERLLLQKQEIKKAYKEGRLEQLIKKRVEDLIKNKDDLNQLERTNKTYR